VEVKQFGAIHLIWSIAWRVPVVVAVVVSLLILWTLTFGPVAPKSGDVIKGRHIIAWCGTAISIPPEARDVTIQNSDIETWPCPFPIETKKDAK